MATYNTRRGEFLYDDDDDDDDLSRINVNSMYDINVILQHQIQDAKENFVCSQPSYYMTFYLFIYLIAGRFYTIIIIDHVWLLCSHLNLKLNN